MKRFTATILLILCLLPISAATEREISITSGYDIYGLKDDPVFMYSIPIGISDGSYFNSTPLGIISEFDLYIPQYYRYGEKDSDPDPFRNSLYMDYTLYAAVKLRMKPLDLFMGIGFFGSVRYLQFNETGTLQVLINAGPRLKIGTDIHICNFLSLRIAVDGSLYLLRNDFLSSKGMETGLAALSVTPEIGMTFNF